ncbi:MAG: hypothetical protein AAF252_14470 [Pseudomonadota bacterium]
MSDIVRFPGAPTRDETAAADQPFSVSDLVEGAIDIRAGAVPPVQQPAPAPTAPAATPDFPHFSNLDWDNQELATLYRAQRLLTMAGIHIETDRGVSDEGEPWFVFLDAYGQVFAHLCRIDGVYLLDSTAQSDLVSGHSLDALVDGFAQKSQPVGTSNRGRSGDIVPLVGRAPAKVLVHPSAALAALIWSIYMLSDDLALPVAEDAAGNPADAATGPDGAVAADLPSEDAAPLEAEGAELTAAPAQNMAQKTGDGRDTAAALHSIAGAPGSAALSKAVGLGLTSIALSYGIHFWFVSDPAPLEDLKESAAGLTTALLATPVADARAEATPEDTERAEATVDALSEESIAADAAALTAADEATAPEDTAAALAEALLKKLAAVDFSSVQLGLQPPPEAEAVPELLAEDSIVAKAPVEVPEDTADSLQIDPGLARTLAELDVFSDIIALEQVETTGVIALSVSAPTALVTADDTQPAAASSAPSYSLFDDSAYDFLVYLMAKGEDTKRSDHAGEIVLVDMDAFEGSGETVYARSWSFEDGSIISTVGLKSDFEAFGLVV